MAESILDHIKKTEASIKRFEKHIQELEQDGVTPDEEKDVNQTKAAIAQLQQEVAKARKEFEADRDKWKSMATQLQTAQEHVKTITEWGTIDIAAVKGDLADAEKNAGEENYRDAIKFLGNVTSGLEKPWAEYDKQFKAMGGYESELQDFESRFTEAKSSKFQNESVKKGIATLDANLPAVKKLAEAKDYAKAVEELQPAVAEMGLIEKEITKASEEDAAARKELEPLKARSTAAGTIEFEELKERVAAAQAKIGAIETKIDAFDYTGARSDIGTLTLEFDAIEAEAEKLKAKKLAEEEKKKKEKEAWDKNVPRYEALKTKVAELETWQSPEAPTLRQGIDEIQSYVQAENYPSAIELLGSTEKALAKPYSEYQKQKEAKVSYDAARSPIDTRAQAARQNQYASDPEAGKMIADLDGDLTFMDGKAKSKDYVQATTKITACVSKLDKIERKLRDLEAEAKYGSGDEARKQLYLQEHPPAKERVDKAQTADVLTKQTGGQLKQYAGSIGTAEKDFKAQKYADALNGVRTVVDEMPLVEEEVRKQTEAKKLFEEALKAAKDSAASFNKSLHKIVREDSAKLAKGFEKGESLAKDHDFDKALAEADSWLTEIQRITDEETKITQQHADADAALIEIQSRVDKAICSDVEALKSAAAELKTLKDEVDKNYKAEDYKAALDSIAKLKAKLEEFEKEEKKAKQKELYEAALQAMRVEERLKAGWDVGYPEAENELKTADGLDKERTEAVASEDFETARTKTFDEGKSLDGFDSKKDEIELSKGQYEHNLDGVKSQSVEALGPMDPGSGELVAAQNKLKETIASMEKAALNKAFIEAAKLLEQAREQLDEVMKIRHDLAPIDEAVTRRFITAAATMSAHAFGGGAMIAVTNFRITVMEKVNEPCALQNFSKWSGYTLDVVAAVASCVPGGGVVGGVAGGVKTVISIAADLDDAAEDAKVQAAGNQLMIQLKTQAGEVEGAFNADFGTYLQSSKPDVFKEIGRYLAQNEDSKANAALKGAGVPIGVGPVATCNAFEGQLNGKMASVWE